MITLRIDRDHLRLVCSETFETEPREKFREAEGTRQEDLRVWQSWWQAFSRRVTG